MPWGSGNSIDDGKQTLHISNNPPKPWHAICTGIFQPMSAYYVGMIRHAWSTANSHQLQPPKCWESYPPNASLVLPAFKSFKATLALASSKYLGKCGSNRDTMSHGLEWHKMYSTLHPFVMFPSSLWGLLKQTYSLYCFLGKRHEPKIFSKLQTSRWHFFKGTAASSSPARNRGRTPTRCNSSRLHWRFYFL